MSEIRILIADDHVLVRCGFRSLLQNIEGVEIVAEASDGRQAWDLICLLRPSLALVDISMPGLNGLELTARVTAEQPATSVIVLSMHAAEEYVLRAVKAGAAGYLIKDAKPVELEWAIHAVSRGETYFSPSAATHLANYYRRGGGASNSRLETLTPRQREILQLIGEGHSTKEIAKLLKVSVKTAEAHRTQLMERLDLHDLAAVVRYAIQVGLVDPES
jgi:DNA-binding NarL/FixJ family response regulator